MELADFAGMAAADVVDAGIGYHRGELAEEDHALGLLAGWGEKFRDFYQANNSEVMVVLLDVESWPGPPAVPTINQGHIKNPQKTHYLNALWLAA
jgi:hypothetical protein